MKIAIDAAILNQAPTGIKKYTYNLISHLLKIDTVNQYFLLFDAPCEDIPQSENCYPVVLEKTSKIPFSWSQFELAKFLKKNKIDVFHCPKNWQYPFYKVCKYVITILDLIPFIYKPKDHSLIDKAYHLFYKTSTLLIKSFADKIITISNNSQKDIEKYLKIKPEKIKITYLSYDEIFTQHKNTVAFEQLKEKYKLNRPFLFHLVGMDDHKNTSGVIKAFRQIHNCQNYQLVLAGKLEWGERYKNLITDLKLENEIILTGYTTDTDLSVLYNFAEVFVFPSLYEGFGLPVLEAMACGCPVVTSNVSSIPEVAGESALLIDPSSVEQLTLAIEKILTDKSLQEQFRQKGLERIKLFSWEQTARETLKIYQSL